MRPTSSSTPGVLNRRSYVTRIPASHFLTIMDACVEEAKWAMRTSSLKGVSRIMSARTGLHRTLWTVAVICFLGVCMLIVSLNILAYLDYPKVVNVEEKPISHEDPNGTVPFPTIAVCNLNPIGSNRSAFEDNGIPLPKDYFKKVREVLACVNCSKEKAESAEIVKTYLATTRGYYQYIGMEAMRKVGNPRLVLSCKVYAMYGSAAAAYPCEQLTTNYSFMIPDAGICYAYSSKPSNDKMIVGFSFTLYLDDGKDNLFTEFEPEFMPPARSGVAMYAFDPNTVPNILGTLALASPGMSTSIYIKAARTDRLPKPYSQNDCIDGDKYDKVPYLDKMFNYDSMSCFGECTVQYVIRKCNCTDLWLIQNPELKPPKYEYCSSLRHPRNKLYENLACSEGQKSHAYDHCRGKCKEPCREIKYGFRQTTAKWPLPSQIGSFYVNVIQKNIYLKNKFSHLEKIANAIQAGDPSVTDWDRSRLSKAIEENFAVGSFYLFDQYYTHYESKPKFTADALISQLGGSFNLWSGITVVIIVELIDYIITVFNRLNEKDKKQESVPLQSAPNINSNHNTDSKESINSE